jgi:hypothetical protein
LIDTNLPLLPSYHLLQNGSLASAPSYKPSPLNSTAPVAIPAPSAPPPGSPSRTRSASTPPLSSSELVTRTVSFKNTMELISEIEKDHNVPPPTTTSPNLYAESTNGASPSAPPPSYDSHVNGASKPEERMRLSLPHTPPPPYIPETLHSIQSGASRDSSRDVPKESPRRDSPRESPRRYSMEENNTTDYPLELSYREESPRSQIKEMKEYQSEHDTSSSSREPHAHRRAVRHMLSRMSSLPSKDVLRITKDIGTFKLSIL